MSRRVPTLLAVFLLGGCTWAPQSQVASLQAENRRLSEQSRAQLAEIANLKVHSRQVEDQLLAAEGGLAAGATRNGIDRRRLANLQAERQRLLRGQLAPDSPNISGDLSGQLADLAKRYPDLFHYDAQTGISKLDTDVLFDSGAAELKPGAEQLLQEFCQILQAPSAESFKVMVVGHTDNQRLKGPGVRERYPNNWHLSSARALAVADRLRELGVPAERMGVAGFGPQQPIASNDAEQTRQFNRRVEIFLAAPDVPIVGMTETLTNLY